ncbi:hypothetical protein F5Y19DRAFT_480727 [Xylariaceae sp. FL1651]|nr:hypothetical protein F5Y19DRAFT_480727 [Xylariaceae sp. FL1651]
MEIPVVDRVRQKENWEEERQANRGRSHTYFESGMQRVLYIANACIVSFLSCRGDTNVNITTQGHFYRVKEGYVTEDATFSFTKPPEHMHDTRKWIPILPADEGRYTSALAKVPTIVFGGVPSRTFSTTYLCDYVHELLFYTLHRYHGEHTFVDALNFLFYTEDPEKIHWFGPQKVYDDDFHCRWDDRCQKEPCRPRLTKFRNISDLGNVLRIRAHHYATLIVPKLGELVNGNNEAPTIATTEYTFNLLRVLTEEEDGSHVLRYCQAETPRDQCAQAAMMNIQFDFIPECGASERRQGMHLLQDFFNHVWLKTESYITIERFFNTKWVEFLGFEVTFLWVEDGVQKTDSFTKWPTFVYPYNPRESGISAKNYWACDYGHNKGFGAKSIVDDSDD